MIKTDCVRVSVEYSIRILAVNSIANGTFSYVYDLTMDSIPYSVFNSRRSSIYGFILDIKGSLTNGCGLNTKGKND